MIACFYSLHRETFSVTILLPRLTDVESFLFAASRDVQRDLGNSVQGSAASAAFLFAASRDVQRDIGDFVADLVWAKFLFAASRDVQRDVLQFDVDTGSL